MVEGTGRGGPAMLKLVVAEPRPGDEPSRTRLPRPWANNIQLSVCPCVRGRGAFNTRSIYIYIYTLAKFSARFGSCSSLR